MNKKMRELLAKIEAKEKAARGYMEGENKDIAKAEETLKEIEALKREYEVEKAIFESEKETNKLSAEDIEEVEKKIKDKKEDEEDKENSTKAFSKAVKTMVNKTLNEGTAESGGYTVPEDISTKVEKLRETKESLRDEITEIGRAHV